MKGFVYILQSQTNGRYYIGSTSDWKRRIEEHNKGSSPYTRTTRPWVVKYLKEFETIEETRKKEMMLKRMKSRKVIEELIAGRLAQW
ncbi:GIY-YIG nuclease family protein [Candidatus Gottesmanbacteria bacterium]|nr:GIY-YIG nuclease family protein [Candidatus Gottesmanbacteria bacterium]